ncbi:MAG: hypothetical protein KC766_01355, partial [Myxococcales bacterium]|nr:hypothetical protein [Myxococcales bacterium]
DLPKTDHLVLAEGELDYQDVASGRRQQIPFTVVVRTSADARTVRASCNRDVLIKTQLIEGLSRVVEAGPAAAAEAATYCEFLHKQGLGNSELAAITRKLTKGGADSKLLLDLKSRRDRGRTRTGLTGGTL